MPVPGTHRRTHIITADPRNSTIIFAGTTLGLFKSPDGGRSWRHLTTDQVNWMVFDPTDPNVFYLATEYAGKVKIGKLNTDDNPATQMRFQIRGIPTLLLFKGGKVVDHSACSGFKSIAPLLRLLGQK